MPKNEALHRQLNIIEDNLLCAMNELDAAIYNMCGINHEGNAVKTSKIKADIKKILTGNYDHLGRK